MLGRNLLLALVTVSLWTDIWDLIAQLAGPWILESTITGSITALYYLGYDVVRHNTILSLGHHGAIDILLGCTGLPILRLLLKLIIAESVVLGLKPRSWYVKATLIAVAISIFIGPFRVAILTARLESWEPIVPLLARRSGNWHVLGCCHGSVPGNCGSPASRRACFPKT